MSKIVNRNLKKIAILGILSILTVLLTSPLLIAQTYPNYIEVQMNVKNIFGWVIASA
ncbi:hypothetical protein [Sulfurisphaera ohwakuensis]|uniref:hypothetical protein n=1 Tax=Sulfurisphaera ohwakuensis TaxID=69656 RepID=UPI0036F44780